jgi:hypothetical protein
MLLLATSFFLFTNLLFTLPLTQLKEILLYVFSKKFIFFVKNQRRTFFFLSLRIKKSFKVFKKVDYLCQVAMSSVPVAPPWSSLSPLLSIVSGPLE